MEQQLMSQRSRCSRCPRPARPALQQLLLVVFLLGQCRACTARPSATGTGQVAARVRGSDDVVFSSGTVPTDTGGEPVHAHDGWLLTNEDAYLWYGSNQKRNVSDGVTWDWLSDAIILYTSHDLGSWKQRATVFTADDLMTTSIRQRLSGGGNGPLRLERPKVLYNAAHRYYVLMVSVSSLDRSRAEVAWAVSVSPYGPFRLDAARQPDGLPTRDITVAAEGDSDAWLARSVPGSGVVISRLTADFLDTEGRCAAIPPAPSQHTSRSQPLQHNSPLLHWLQQHTGPLWAALAGSLRSGGYAAFRVLTRVSARNQQQLQRVELQEEQQLGLRSDVTSGAPCLFKFRGKWYLLVSAKAGWSPSRAVLYVNDGSSPCDEASWRKLPTPAQGPGASHTFDSTPAFVYAHTFEGSDKVLLVYFGDRWNAADPSGPSNASYVWLPLVPADSTTQTDNLQLLNLHSWRLGDFRPSSTHVQHAHTTTRRH